jgi:hypothetical protein
MFLSALHRRPEIHVESFLALIAALRSNVWRIIYDGTKPCGPYAFHYSVISDDVRLVLWINIHRNHTP